VREGAEIAEEGCVGMKEVVYQWMKMWEKTQSIRMKLGKCLGMF
jgi:hypothetical protein